MVNSRKIATNKIKSLKKDVGKVINDYISQTSIHGFRYLIEGKRINNFFWFIALVFSVVGCVSLIKQTYSKWNESPVIVSFAQKSTPLWSIPLPSVTICPEIKYKRSFFNLTINSETGNVTDPLLKNYQNSLYPICPWSYPIFMKETPNFAVTVKLLAIPLEEVFGLKDFNDQPYAYTKFFSEILTDDGMCFTYNMLNHEELLNDVIDDSMKYPRHNKSSTFWNLQSGYSDFSTEVYPFRVLGSGIKAGLEIRLTALKEDVDYKCKGPVQGFKLALHSPADFPRLTVQYYRIPLNKEVMMSVVPKVIETADNLRKYNPNIRQCYFEGEKALKFFKIYTESNCKLECLSNYTVKTCGCTRFGYPHDNNTSVCHYRKQDCAARSEFNWIIATWNPKTRDTTSDACNCLPSCHSIAYEAESSYGEFYYNEFLTSIKTKFDEDKYASLVNIYFKEDAFISVTRSELYGVVDFLSNCGGLLGLFMGISILSMVEFVYYFSLRWVCATKENPEHDEDDHEKDDDDKNNKIIKVKEFDNSEPSTISGSVKQVHRVELNNEY